MKLLPLSIAALISLGIAASAPAYSAEGGMHQGPGMRGGPMGDHHGRHHGSGKPAFLRGVVLTDEQQKKVFAIKHAQEPVRFEQMAALRKAHESLRELSASGQFDEAKAAALADAAGKATAAMALGHARADAQVMALLTPEQRKQAQQEKERPAPRK